MLALVILYRELGAIFEVLDSAYLLVVVGFGGTMLFLDTTLLLTFLQKKRDEQFYMMVGKYCWWVIGVVERNWCRHHMILGGFRKYSAHLLVVVVFEGTILFLDASLMIFLQKKSDDQFHMMVEKYFWWVIGVVK